MGGSYSGQETSFGELMECLMREKERYSSEEEFRKYAISAVRRFITDLRRLDIEIALRSTHFDKARLSDQMPR